MKTAFVNMKIAHSIQLLFSILAISLLCSCGAAVSKSKDVDEILARAWREYNIEEFDLAQSAFQRAKERSKGNKENLCEAMTGLAFCQQFGRKLNVEMENYQKAIEIYKEIVKLIETDKKLSDRFMPFIHSMIAECYLNIYYMNGDTEAKEKADRHMAWLRKNCYTSIHNQEAILIDTVKSLEEIKSKDTVGNARKIEEYVDYQQRHPGQEEDIVLISPMAQYMGNIYYWRNNYDKSLDWLIEYDEAGVSSYALRAINYYKIATIAEEKLNDKKTAAEYFRKLHANTGNDARAYYSKLKERKLRKELRSKKEK